MSDNGIAFVEFDSQRAAQELGIPVEQVKLLARRLEISAPYTQGQIDAMRLELGEEQQDQAAIATSPDPTPSVLKEESFIVAIADVLEIEITEALVNELRPRMGRIKGNVIARLKD